MSNRISPKNRRSWLFLPGAEREVLMRAAGSGADVLIQELEDFTAPDRRPQARAMSAEVFDAWRAAKVLTAVRVNPLETVGLDDLSVVMPARPDIVLMSKVVSPAQVIALQREVNRLEALHGIAIGSTELVPNVETALGVINTYAIACASPQVTALLVASEDMAADLGVERSRGGYELAYARSRFLMECTAAKVVAIDCPYTFSDEAGALADAAEARRLGFVAKSLVDQSQVALVNRALTPSPAEIKRAQEWIAAFEAARAQGLGRAEWQGALVETPMYASAKRLLIRAQALGVFEA